jgi:hypothetical protein
MKPRYANWLRGHVTAWRKKQFVPSTWWQVWVLVAIPISIGIPAITMTVNSPTLPPVLAAACVVATLLGLAVALLPGKWAAERPLDLIWLVADSLGLMPALLLLRAVELPGRGVSVGHSVAWLFAMGGLFGHSISCGDRGNRPGGRSDQRATLAKAKQTHLAIRRCLAGLSAGEAKALGGT